MNSPPRIMGILNCTPDSFYDGGRHRGTEGAVERAMRMVKEGADIIDVGGESTRPGAEPIGVEEEMDRTVPVIKILRRETTLRISIDTTKAEVAAVALDAGANLINDVSGLRLDGGLSAMAVRYRVPIILMHSRGHSNTMQSLTDYADVVSDVRSELGQSVKKALHAGIDHRDIWIDPGFGFAKDMDQNIALLKDLDQFKGMGHPLVVGLSRKSFIGKILDQPDPQDRLIGSLAALAYAVLKGADVLRVHDVKETAELVKILFRLQ